MAAVTEGNEYVLTGDELYLIDGMIAQKLLVVARTGGVGGDQHGLSLFMVDRELEGLSFTGVLTADNHQLANIQFNSVRVGSEALLGEAGNCW